MNLSHHVSHLWGHKIASLIISQVAISSPIIAYRVSNSSLKKKKKHLLEAIGEHPFKEWGFHNPLHGTEDHMVCKNMNIDIQVET